MIDLSNYPHLLIHLSPGLQDWGSLHSSTSCIWHHVSFLKCHFHHFLSLPHKHCPKFSYQVNINYHCLKFSKLSPLPLLITLTITNPHHEVSPITIHDHQCSPCSARLVQAQNQLHTPIWKRVRFRDVFGLNFWLIARHQGKLYLINFTFRKERNSGKGSDIAWDLSMTKAMMVTKQDQ